MTAKRHRKLRTIDGARSGSRRADVVHVDVNAALFAAEAQKRGQFYGEWEPPQ